MLDEAVASLDDESATHVAATVNELRGKMTILFIPHKLPANLRVDSHVHLKRTA